MSSNNQAVEIGLSGLDPQSHGSKNAPDSSEEATPQTEAADLKLQPLFYLTAKLGIYGL